MTATHPFRLIVLSCLLTVEGRTETPVDFFRSEAKVELDFLLFLKDEIFKLCLSDWTDVGGPPGLVTVVRSHVFSVSFHFLNFSFGNSTCFVLKNEK